MEKTLTVLIAATANTAFSAYLGAAFAVLFALILNALGQFSRRSSSTRCAQGVAAAAAEIGVAGAIIFYLLPPIAIGQIMIVFGLRYTLPPIFAACVVTFILTILLGEAYRGAMSRFALDGVGYSGRRLIYGTLPLAIPDAILCVASCMPWAVLGAMLGEMASGQRSYGTLGILVAGALQTGGLNAAWPACIAASALSVGPYFVLTFVAAYLRKRWSLTERRISSEALLASGYRYDLVGVLTILCVVTVVWIFLHQRAPVLVPAVAPLIERISRPDVFLKLFGSMKSTVELIIIVTVFGTFLGYAAAIFGLISKGVQRLISVALLPLQILPLVVFVPLFAMFQRWIEDAVLAGRYRFSGDPPFPMAELVLQASTLVVGLLTCVFGTYMVADARLAELPRGLGPLMSARPRLDGRVLRHLYVPWLARSLGTALQIAIPRAALAVLVSEAQITNVGLGQLLYSYRGRGDYMELWAGIVAFLAIVLVLHGGTNVFASRRD